MDRYEVTHPHISIFCNRDKFLPLFFLTPETLSSEKLVERRPAGVGGRGADGCCFAQVLGRSRFEELVACALALAFADASSRAASCISISVVGGGVGGPLAMMVKEEC